MYLVLILLYIVFVVLISYIFLKSRCLKTTEYVLLHICTYVYFLHITTSRSKTRPNPIFIIWFSKLFHR